MALVLPMPGPGAGSAQASALQGSGLLRHQGSGTCPSSREVRLVIFVFHFLSSRSKLEVLNLKLLEKRLLGTNLLWRQLSIFLLE